MNLAQLRARLKELAGEIDVLTKKDSMSADDLVQIDATTKELEEVEKNIDILQKAEAARIRAAAPAAAHITEQRTLPAEPVQKLTTSEKIGLMVAGMAKAHIETGMKGAAATFKAMEDAGFGTVAKEFADAHKQRALNSGSAAAGGVLVPENMANEIIDILRPNTTFLQAGPRRVPLIGGNYKVPAAASGATAGWRGEGKPVATSQPTFKDINMTTKFLDTLVPLTNQLIRFSLPDVRAWVEMDMSQSMGVELDRAAYYGSGTVNQPLGITKIQGIFRQAATGGQAPTITQIESDASDLELSMMNANLPMLGAAWVMNPTTFIFLQNLRDSLGNRFYPELQNATPTWRNKRVFVTTQVPANGGVTTDESEILLVAFGHVLFGEGTSISFYVSNEASYVKDGVTVSAFQSDLTLIKASAEADVDMRYLESVAVLSSVRWGR